MLAALHKRRGMSVITSSIDHYDRSWYRISLWILLQYSGIWWLESQSDSRKWQGQQRASEDEEPYTHGEL